MKTYYTYILQCSAGTFYVGMTSNLERRLQEHELGVNEDAYTFNKRPVELKWFEEFSDVQQAIATEKQLKGWSRRKKIALFERDWEKLVLYSKNYTQFGKVGASTSSAYKACLPEPVEGTFCSSKTFIDYWSRALTSSA